jgi:hypothetical protein
VKRQANAHHDPENFDLQQLLGNSQGVQASRTGRLRRAPSQTTPCGRRNRPARLKSDGLLDQRTVAKFVRAGSFPERAPRTSGLTLLDGHRQYVASRTTEGCVKPVHVWNELRARGFTGSLGTVRSAMARDRAAAAGTVPTAGRAKGTLSVSAQSLCLACWLARPTYNRAKAQRSSTLRRDAVPYRTVNCRWRQSGPPFSWPDSPARSLRI